MVHGLLVVGGLAILIAGGELLVRGGAGLALAARLPPAIVGLTIVAAGTSMPELVVTLRSALSGSAGLAVGNVVGSNVFNIAAILGIAALVSPLKVLGNTIRLEWPVMVLASAQLYLLARDGLVDRVEGGSLFVGLLAFTAYAVWVARNVATEDEVADAVDVASTATNRWTGLVGHVVAVGIGVALLALGAQLLIQGSVVLATAAGVSETVIGLTIVAAGTSTPELVTSIVASYRGRDDIAITNIVGSNIFNVLGIVGGAALVVPLEVPAGILTRDIWWMLGTTVVLLPLMRTGMHIGRVEGMCLLGAYGAYSVHLLVS